MNRLSSPAWSTEERRALRATVRRFTEQEVLPHLDAWERGGELPRELSKKAGALGLLGVAHPIAAGGAGGAATSRGSRPRRGVTVSLSS